MKSRRTGYWIAGLAGLHLLSACGETRYVIVSGNPQGYHGSNVTLQPVAEPPECIKAPIGYVIPQDKWDPYSIPCPPQVAIVAMRSGKSAPKGSPGSPGSSTPTTPTPSTPSRSAAQASETPNDTGASMTPTSDGGTRHEITIKGRVVATEVTYP